MTTISVPLPLQYDDWLWTDDFMAFYDFWVQAADYCFDWFEV